MADLMACVDDAVLGMRNIAYVLTERTRLQVILLINIEGVSSEVLGWSQRTYGLLSSAREI